ncbi:biotin--acetyl-CoA-carboxylase ligase [Haloferax mucosum ATCC BAA-1512]|uniref:Biotin--acetyl-CoA-carboxylase ligase n=1 Tax=Haloferax mucosum ATCC BAA-1512 TaxID=662479 RepID=M0IIY8_9EURY|nr:biotin--[acetyl-CoA-carboxylase] ligase [Haloferax mucosum]ELZ96725.1 biotin--acetyl-CoA-carboxylase ligase [Haloferax mucosum ATCC BAA-1512]
MSDTRRALLDALAEGPVSGPDLADRLGVSRAAVWKHVESLRDDGFEVESTADGYAITDVPEYGGPAIEFGLDADYDVEFHEALASSNDRARELAAEGATDVAVVAREQIASKGRKGREWSAPDGGVWMSLLVRPDEPPAHAPLYTLAMAVAVCDAAREAGVDASIKWPNDVIVSGTRDGAESDRAVDSGESDRGYRKLCGILTEMEGEADRVSWLVIGPGTNVNLDPETLPEGATSISAEAGAVERRVFVQRVLERFDELRADLDGVLPAWRERADTLGRHVRVHTAGGVLEGKAVDVEHPGTLVVQTSEGETRVHAGDCEHLRPATDGGR